MRAMTSVRVSCRIRFGGRMTPLVVAACWTPRVRGRVDWVHGQVSGAEGRRRCLVHHGGRFDVVYQQLSALQIGGDDVEDFGGPGGVRGGRQGLTCGGGHHRHVVRKR